MSNWELTGLKVKATYLEQEVEGTVESSRVAYGGRVLHTLVLDKPLIFTWSTEERNRCIIEHYEIKSISSN